MTIEGYDPDFDADGGGKDFFDTCEQLLFMRKNFVANRNAVHARVLVNFHSSTEPRDQRA